MHPTDYIQVVTFQLAGLYFGVLERPTEITRRSR